MRFKRYKYIFALQHRSLWMPEKRVWTSFYRQWRANNCHFSLIQVPLSLSTKDLEQSILLEVCPNQKASKSRSNISAVRLELYLSTLAEMPSYLPEICEPTARVCNCHWERVVQAEIILPSPPYVRCGHRPDFHQLNVSKN